MAISETKHFGVSQGSVLGSMLFLVYANDIANAAPNQTVKLFADDTNLFWPEVQSRLLLIWLITQVLNTGKTVIMVFSWHRIYLTPQRFVLHSKILGTRQNTHENA